MEIETTERKRSTRSALWRGQVFMFDKPIDAGWRPDQGLRLLAIFAFLEFAFRPLLGTLAKSFGFNHQIWWQLASQIIFLGTAILVTLVFAKVNLAQIGLRPWKSWSATEKHYFVQTLIITIDIFATLNFAGLKSIWLGGKIAQNALFLFLPQMVWGFYQEFLYRGLLQGELVRRWGPVRGILASNLVFTFGPLHFYNFELAARHHEYPWIFAGIFTIGLYFSILYHRSGNLWIIGILHGLGDFFVDGLRRILK